jgi:Family of unknown function (DUF5681)
MSTSNRDNSNGPVGYGRPPVERRFKPGQSGNPKGRPKNRKDVAGMLKDILERPIKIRGGSGVRNITMLQAILEVTANKAVAGDARALGFVMQVVEKLELFKKFEPPEDHQRRSAELRQTLERLIELKAEERMQAELIRREQEQQDPDSEVNHTDCGVDKHS